MSNATPVLRRWCSFFPLFCVVLFFFFLFPGDALAQGFFKDWLNDKKAVEETAPIPDELAVEEEKPEPVIVFLDAGHGGVDLGAQSSRHVLEKNVTLNIVKAIKKKLSGYDRIEVITSRISDISMKPIERINFANASDADIFVSVHTDGGMAPRSHALKIFINSAKDVKTGSWNTLNGKFAEDNDILAEKIVIELDKKNNGRGVDVVKTDRLYLGALLMPAVLVEALDLSNPEDEMRIEEGAYLKEVADAIANGLLDFLFSSGKI